MKRSTRNLSVLALGFILILASCAAPASDPMARESQGVMVKSAAPSEEIRHPPAEGPKKRIAVSKFGTIGAFAAVYGGWDIGGGLAAQLTTELVNSGRFVVVERAALADVLREHEMALEKVVARETAVKVGRLIGAQLLIRGEVTEFEQRARGGGGRIGIGGFPIGGMLGLQTTSAHVGLDIRLIDTATGQVIQSRRSEGTASETGLAVEIDTRTVSFGGDVFQRTPLGKATRQAISDAVMFISQQMEKVTWTGRVVEVEGDKAYINAGSSANIKVGDTFVVSAVVKELIDPETQQVLGVLEDKLGEIRVQEVRDKFSIATIVGDFRPKKGDILKFK